MNRPIKYIVLLCFLIFSSSIYSQSCEDCAIYNAALGCYAVAVCDDPNATNYCPADYYINSGSHALIHLLLTTQIAPIALLFLNNAYTADAPVLLLITTIRMQMLMMDLVLYSQGVAQTLRQLTIQVMSVHHLIL